MIDEPPVFVGAVKVTSAVEVLPVGTDAFTPLGDDGALALTPIVIVAVPVSTVPLGRVVETVITNCVGEIATVGVPEISPVFGSKVKPAGSGPAIE